MEAVDHGLTASTTADNVKLVFIQLKVVYVLSDKFLEVSLPLLRVDRRQEVILVPLLRTMVATRVLFQVAILHFGEGRPLILRLEFSIKLEGLVLKIGVTKVGGVLVAKLEVAKL
mmetsp:Transcript_37631/g.57666  ORF Transcript_37631/g.57666 Transcript_37631/m.57666 type:complete len:115 (+) Transcript_37631:2513-2857(+)